MPTVSAVSSSPSSRKPCMDGAPVAALLALAPLTSMMRLASVLSCAQVEDAPVYWWARSPIDQPGALPESSFQGGGYRQLDCVCIAIRSREDNEVGRLRRERGARVRRGRIEVMQPGGGEGRRVAERAQRTARKPAAFGVQRCRQLVSHGRRTANRLERSADGTQCVAGSVRAGGE